MPSDLKERHKQVDLAISQIERQFGKGSIMKLGDQLGLDVPVISTTSLSVDYALGVGGIPRGRVIEIFGPESSGKTTLALHVVAEAQRTGGIAAFVDAEHAVDPEYANKLGVDVDNLMVSQPDCGEQALEISEILIRSGAMDVVVSPDTGTLHVSEAMRRPTVAIMTTVPPELRLSHYTHTRAVYPAGKLKCLGCIHTPRCGVPDNQMKPCARASTPELVWDQVEYVHENDPPYQVYSWLGTKPTAELRRAG